MTPESDDMDNRPHVMEDADPDGPLDIHRKDVRTGEVGRTFDSGEGRVFPCEGCGADLEFNALRI